MATVRISGELHSHHQTEWVGAPDVGADGRIDRSVPLPEEAFEAFAAVVLVNEKAFASDAFARE